MGRTVHRKQRACALQLINFSAYEQYILFEYSLLVNINITLHTYGRTDITEPHSLYSKVKILQILGAVQTL